MPKRYPPQFHRDVVHVARTSGLTHAQIAEDFGTRRRNQAGRVRTNTATGSHHELGHRQGFGPKKLRL